MIRDRALWDRLIEGATELLTEHDLTAQLRQSLSSMGCRKLFWACSAQTSDAPPWFFMSTFAVDSLPKPAGFNQLVANICVFSLTAKRGCAIERQDMWMLSSESSYYTSLLPIKISHLCVMNSLLPHSTHTNAQIHGQSIRYRQHTNDCSRCSWHYVHWARQMDNLQINKAVSNTYWA